MSWTRLFVGFELHGPLHIGMLPNQAGTVVARTRCYVPGKNLWGAVTDSLTRRVHDAPTGEQFRETGQAVREALVFSYFYLSDGDALFPPHYTASGLCWGVEEDTRLGDRQFHARFVDSLVSTGIEGESGSARAATLHEIEFIRPRVGMPSGPVQPVILVGAVWLRDGSGVAGHSFAAKAGSVFLGEHDILAPLVLGGERNYGFGRLARVDVGERLRAQLEGWWPDDPVAPVALRTDQPLPAHARYRPDRAFKGAIEIIAGREYPSPGDIVGFHAPGKRVRNSGYFFAPGTRVDPGHTTLRMDSWGRLSWMDLP